MDGATLIALFAAGTVGVAAYLLGRASGRRDSPPLPRDYYRGLDHLLNERLDRATEAFVRLAERDGDAIEIQWALGTLFRRRGEFDRAIALHERLASAADRELRERARMELAQDYLAAGLMDRAERLLSELATTPSQQAAATLKLMQLYETEGDWAEALRAFEDLPASLRDARASQAAHYLCELAEQALAQGDAARAETLLQQASRHDAACARTAFLRARAAERRADHAAAVDFYVAAVAQAPDLLIEVSQRIRAWPAANATVALGDMRRALQAGGKLTDRQLELCLGVETTRADDALGAYTCTECGMPSARWFWRCPGCRSWSSLALAALGTRGSRRMPGVR